MIDSCEPSGLATLDARQSRPSATNERPTTHAGPAQLNKPAALPDSALWYVYLSQSFDGGATFTQNQVSNVSNYYGDVCNTGIFCGNGSPFGWGDDRILFEDFGLAVGPDGGARLDWTDSRTSGCTAGVNATSCQSGRTHIVFACQTSGLGIHGETMTGCGQSLSVQTPELPWVPDVVGVGQRHQLALARQRRQAGGPRRRRTAGPIPPHHLAAGDRERRRRAVVHHDHPLRRRVLPEHRAHRLLQPGRGRLDRHDHADPHGG